MFAKKITLGGCIPRFYGIAWREFGNGDEVAVCMPVPLNLAAGLLRGAYHLIRHPAAMVRVNPRAAYAQGYEAGMRNGITEGQLQQAELEYRARIRDKRDKRDSREKSQVSP